MSTPYTMRDAEVLDQYGKRLKARQAAKKKVEKPTFEFDDKPPLQPLPGQLPLPLDRPGDVDPREITTAEMVESLRRRGNDWAADRLERYETERADESRKPTKAPPPAEVPKRTGRKAKKEFRAARPAAYRQPPIRAAGVKHNESVRSREHLSEAEVYKLIAAIEKRGSITAARDAMIIFMAYRHGLRVSELSGLKMDQVLWESSELHVKRVKRGIPSTHSLVPKELKWLKRVVRKSGFIFTTTDGHRLSNSSLDKMISAAGKLAGFTERVHFHMLRHSCGYELVNSGTDLRLIQKWLGHANIQHTILYTQLSGAALRKIKIGE